jgi:exonuclease III
MQILLNQYQNPIFSKFLYVSWNIDGLSPRMNKDFEKLQEFSQYVDKCKPSLLFIQEPRLRACPKKGWGYVHALDAKHLTDFMALFPMYECFPSLATTKGSGQLMLLRADVQRPEVRYNYGVESSRHDDEGRIIIAEFSDQLVVGNYVPNSGTLKRDKLLRRQDFDKKTNSFLANHSKISRKTTIHVGDLNVAANTEDMSDQLEYWATTAIENPYFSKPEDFEDTSFPDTSRNERLRFHDQLKSADLVDTGDSPP